jgi:hypothetical protein
VNKRKSGAVGGAAVTVNGGVGSLAGVGESRWEEGAEGVKYELPRCRGWRKKPQKLT